jgi:ABC-2 type transport system permease protein
MLRRNLRHMQRYPSLTLMLVGQPIVFLLLFVYVFGGTMGAGIAGAASGRAEYLAYITPGILAMTVASVALGTALSVAMDMTEGIMARFRTMDIGFRPTAGPFDWLAALAVLAIFAFALTWLTVALGLASDSVETASNTPMFLVLMPFLGSGFVPTESMPIGLRWFADYQPFTPVIESVRGLLTGTPVGNDVVLALGWSVVIALGSYLWAKKLYNRDPKS